MSKTTSGDTYLEGPVYIAGDLIVEDNITADSINARTITSVNSIATNTVATNSTITNATIGTEAVSNSTITNATIGTAGITNAHVGALSASVANIASETVTTLDATNVNIHNSSITFDSLAFYYINGTWQPIMTYLYPDTHLPNTIDFVNLPGTTNTVNYENGYFERIGSQVTVHFSCSYTSGNSGYGPAADYGFPAIRNLPFTFGTLGGVLDYQEVEELGTCSWPNGFAGASPTLYTPVYPYPYQGKLYEANATCPLDLWLYLGLPVAVYKGPHTFDGQTIAIYADVEFYEAAAAVPPYALSSNVSGLLTNFNMLLTSSYVCSFEGRFTYNT